MSTRYLKKVFGSDVLLKNKYDISDDEEEASVQRENGKAKMFNVFDLLSESENDVHQNEKEVEGAQEEEDDLSENESKNFKNKTRKKQRKNKKSQKLKNENQVSKDNVDDIDKTIEEINKLLGEPEPSTSQHDPVNNFGAKLISKSKEQMLCVQHKNLNPVNELKRIFGSKTIQAEKKSRNRGRSGHIKKTWLASLPNAMHPIVKSGLSMTIDKTVNAGTDVLYFVYEHSQSYRQIQQKFIEAVESINPENIINIVNEYPFHVDALLQSAEVCKLSEELAMAAMLIEQALFYLEYAFHPLFNMTTGKCRLDYRKQQNRALFITLFKHLVLVGGRACYRTSLEFCKLLLSLDPESDPLAVILMIDFYAIRSKEYEWFSEFCNLWENARNLTQLPNIAYSLSLAYFHMGDEEKANEYLQNALIMFPGVLIPLLDKCSVNTDSKVVTHSFFTTKAATSTPPSLEKLQSLYIARSFHLWKEADILPWLEKQVNIVLKRADVNDDYVKFAYVKRSKRYQGKLPKNILRHIILSDIKDVSVNLQDSHADSTILSHDPLPPTDSINIYSNPSTSRRSNQGNSNLLSLFLQSIFSEIERDLGGLHPQNEN